MSRNRMSLIWIPLSIIIAAIFVWTFALNTSAGDVFTGFHEIFITDTDEEQLEWVKLSPNGAFALVSVNGNPDSLRLYDSATGTQRWELFESPNRYLHSFTTDSTQYIVGGEINLNFDEPDQIWYVNTDSGEVDQAITLQTDEHPLAANETYYSTAIASSLTIYETTSEDIYFQHEFERDLEWGQLTPDGKTLVVATSNAEGNGYSFYLINLEEPEVADPTFDGENLATIEKGSVAISSDSRYLAFAHINGVGVFVIDLETYAPVFSVFGDQLTSDKVSNVRLDPLFGFLSENMYFAYMTNEGIAYGIELSTGEIVDQFDPGYRSSSNSFAVSADGSRIALINRDRLAIWER